MHCAHIFLHISFIDLELQNILNCICEMFYNMMHIYICMKFASLIAFLSYIKEKTFFRLQLRLSTSQTSAERQNCGLEEMLFISKTIFMSCHLFYCAYDSHSSTLLEYEARALYRFIINNALWTTSICSVVLRLFDWRLLALRRSWSRKKVFSLMWS